MTRQIGIIAAFSKPEAADLANQLRLHLQQAGRVADYTAFFLLGRMIEFGETDRIFTAPGDERTEDYITGRFG